MSSTYTCKHDGEQHRTEGEISLLHCGHDGTTHLACQPALPPEGTPRPDGWPTYLSWPYPWQSWWGDSMERQQA